MKRPLQPTSAIKRKANLKKEKTKMDGTRLLRMISSLTLVPDNNLSPRKKCFGVPQIRLPKKAGITIRGMDGAKFAPKKALKRLGCMETLKRK